MRIERVMRHEVSADDVYEMSILKEFQEKKCADAGALSWDVRVTLEGNTAVIRTKRKLPTVGFPSIVRKIVPSGVTSTETISWAAPDADGTRRAKLHVDFHGAPAKMSGTITLTSEPDGGAKVTVDAEFTALVPLVGGKVEKMSAPIILGVIDSEERTGRAWIADAV